MIDIALTKDEVTGKPIGHRPNCSVVSEHPPWWVVHCESQREHLVRLLLERAGFAIYFPRIKHRSRIAPLFPGYLFVRIAAQWSPVQSTIGVIRVLMAGDQPAHLADGVIAAIRTREKGGFVKYPVIQPPQLKKGQQVRIVNGSFQGHLGIYDGMSGKDRERILLNLLGQSVSVALPSKDLAPLAIASPPRG